jgi:tRNA pseudouridine55 synthase
MDGALLVDKPEGISSFAVIERLKRAWLERARREAEASSRSPRLGASPLLDAATGTEPQQRRPYRTAQRIEIPKLGHGGTLDPFATGLLVVGVGRGVKLLRYFLGSDKEYEAEILFGQTSTSGDTTDPVTERCSQIPHSLEDLRNSAIAWVGRQYLQTPPMHSAKKKDGKPLYELARQGLEVDRPAEPRLIHAFDFTSYAPPVGHFRVRCSSGTYIRVLAQDFGRHQGSLAVLRALRRTRSGSFDISRALPLAEIEAATLGGALENGSPANPQKAPSWQALSCWVPFDSLLAAELPIVEASPDEALALQQGKQAFAEKIGVRAAIPGIARLAVYCRGALVAVLENDGKAWGIERVYLGREEP